MTDQEEKRSSNACESKWPTLEVVDCFKYLVLQVAADKRYEMDMVHRMNVGYKA